jgi:hypothetical protein
MCPDGLVTPNRDIWGMGVPLRDAPYDFAPDDLRAVLDAPQIPWPVPYLGELLLGFLKNAEGERDPRYSDWTQQLRESKDRVAAQMAVSIEMADRLLSDIRDGRYVAYGYKKPRDVKDRRVKIPADLFEREYINWENSSINGADLEFVSVLVFESGLEQEIDTELKQSPAAKRRSKRGPSSSSGAIEETIRFLIADRSLPNHDLKKQNVELVRKCVHQLYPGEFPKDRGLSDESIRKVLEKLIPRQRS